jgi:hypothetical protein
MTMADVDAQDTHADRRERYQRVLRTVGHQTTPQQLPGVRPRTVAMILGDHGHEDADAVERALRAAVENDDLVQWRDRNANRRVTLCTEPDLRRLATHLAEELVDVDQLARINTVLQEGAADE